MLPKGKSPRGPVPPAAPKSGAYSKLRECDGYDRDERFRTPTIGQVVMLFLSTTMLFAMLILFQSLRNNQASIIQGSFQPEDEMNPELASAAAAAMEKMNMVDAFESNDREWLLKQFEQNGTIPCDQVSTAHALVFGLEHGNGVNTLLGTNRHHLFRIVTYSKDGTQRCAGGDFYETDLSGPNWKSRPPIKDLGDGTYLVDLWVDDRMAGLYTLKINLAFSSLHGLDFIPTGWAKDNEVMSLGIEFTADPSSHPHTNSPTADQQNLPLCAEEDFKQNAWRGRWTNMKRNESCVPEEGRYLCLSPDEQCEEPWCEGPLGVLESNGWVYSAHCAFRLFSQQEAWSCLNGRSLFFWGDSNHQDTVRNLLNFVLGLDVLAVDRMAVMNFSNPENSSQSLHIINLFNGHYDMSQNGLGLQSLDNYDYRKTVESFFLPSNEVIPDTFIFNSGLHDAVIQSFDNFAQVARYGSQFLGSLWRNSSLDKSRRFKIVFRTTVAAAPKYRFAEFNPHKMEAYNTVLREELQATFDRDTLKIVDGFDLTFPFHYDNQYSDGLHYGRPPHPDGIFSHKYFVDIMLAHILVNAVCPN